MSFNRRGPDRRSDRPPRREGYADRPPRREGYPDRPPRREGFADRPAPGGYPPRDRPPRPEGGGRPGGDRPYAPRRFDRPPDEGAMSIRLDPRRLGTLKHLAGEAGMRPGDLVRQWVEERLDALRTGEPDGPTLEARVAALEDRVAALTGGGTPDAAADVPAAALPEPSLQSPEEVSAVAESEERSDGDEEASAAPAEDDEASAAPGPEDGAPAPARRRRVSAAPSGRVALHDEMIAVLAERGPLTAAELASAIGERGRYAPPRSGRSLDASMVSQRASNPTYRSRFMRREGRIGLAEES